MQITLVAFIAISLCYLPNVKSVSCLNGKEVEAENGTVIENNVLKTVTCDSSEVTQECHRYDVVFTTPTHGSVIYKEAACYNTKNCEDNNCETIVSLLQEAKFEVRNISSCCFYCCDTDDCNEISASRIDKQEACKRDPTGVASSLHYNQSLVISILVFMLVFIVLY